MREPRLAVMAVHIDETWKDQHATRIDDFLSRDLFARSKKSDDLAVTHSNFGRKVPLR